MPLFLLASEEDVLARLRTIENEIDSEQDAGFRAALINTHLAHWESQRERVAEWMRDGDERSDAPMVPIFNDMQCERVLDVLRRHLKRIDASVRIRLILNGFGPGVQAAAE